MTKGSPPFNTITISEKQALQYLNFIVGKKISDIWINYGTLFIDIGDLHKLKTGRLSDDYYDYHFMIHPGWRFQNQNSITCHIDNDEDYIKKVTNAYVGKTIKKIEIISSINEIMIYFDDIIFVTFATMLYDDCGWVFFDNSDIKIKLPNGKEVSRSITRLIPNGRERNASAYHIFSENLEYKLVYNN